MGDETVQEEERSSITMKEQQDALRDGRILGFECMECGVRRLTPMAICPNGHHEIRVKEFATTGTVETYTIQQVASEQFMNEVPFAWAIIALDEGGPRVSGWIPFIAKPDDLPMGAQVKYSPSYKPGMRFEKVEG